jgi:sugar lactone lactonase YvrE
MKQSTVLAGLLVIAALVPVAVRAEHTRYWRQTDFSEFEKGTANGVAIRSDGKLMPAPKFDSFADPNLAYLWALRLDSHGRLYAAGGTDAKVVRFDGAGKPTTVFESPELVAQAIAFDAKDNLYVGTSPDGKVYQVTPDGKKSIFFDPKTKYIWALALDSRGALFVATGDTGQVFVVTPDGKGQLFYQSQQRHARSLAFDSKGNLLIGTEPDGLILRVDVARKTPQSAPEAGKAFVVYETNNAEVTSLIVDAAGNLYAASIGEKTRAPGLPRINIPSLAPQTPAPSAAPAAANPGVVVSQAQPQAQQQPSIPYSFPAVSSSRGAEVVKIAPDGSPETLWTSREDLVFSLGLSPAGKILLGTGDNGAVIELEGDDVYASVAKAASAQVTDFVAASDGRIFVATANPGKIFTLGPGYQSNGSFESDTFDAKIFSRWGRLTWWGENGATAGKVAFYVRSGNTSSAEENWSPWAGPYNDAAGARADCPSARFVQWKAVFLETDKGLPPSISWVSLAYQPKNVAPAIDDIAIQEPGIRVTGFPAQPTGPGTAAPVQLRYPRSPGGNPSFPVVTAEASGRNSQMEVPPQGFEQKGYQSVLWSAHDDNDDDLVFAIYYRAESEQNWLLLKDRLTQRHYSWDTTSMPDGAYYLKIVASDSPSNPPDQALSAGRTSDRWLVANTPPRIENLRAGSGVLNTRASLDAISSSDPIARAEYSVDAGEWQVVFPADVLSDAPNESYAIQLPGLPPGEHVLAVRVVDRARNVTAAEVTFTVQPHGAP